MLLWMKTVLKENYLLIDKLRSLSLKFSYTDFMMNMTLLSVVTPPSIYQVRTYLSMSGVRGYIWLNIQFTPDRNTKESMKKTWNWLYSIDTYSMICILMAFLTIMGCVLFNLILTLYKYDSIWAIIIIKRIKYGFMCVTIQILNTGIDTLERRKPRCHSLGW